MQITLKQSHVEAAIRDYVAKAGITFPVDDINFTAGRGKDGLTATVEMEDPFAVDAAPSANAKPAKVEKAEPAFAAPKAVPTPAAAEPEVEEVPDAVAEEKEEAVEEEAPAVEEEKDEQPMSKQAPPFAQEEDEPAPQPKKEKVNLFG